MHIHVYASVRGSVTCECSVRVPEEISGYAGMLGNYPQVHTSGTKHSFLPTNM